MHRNNTQFGGFIIIVVHEIFSHAPKMSLMIVVRNKQGSLGANLYYLRGSGRLLSLVRGVSILALLLASSIRSFGSRIGHLPCL